MKPIGTSTFSARLLAAGLVLLVLAVTVALVGWGLSRTFTVSPEEVAARKALAEKVEADRRNVARKTAAREIPIVTLGSGKSPSSTKQDGKPLPDSTRTSTTAKPSAVAAKKGVPNKVAPVAPLALVPSRPASPRLTVLSLDEPTKKPKELPAVTKHDSKTKVPATKEDHPLGVVSLGGLPAGGSDRGEVEKIVRLGRLSPDLNNLQGATGTLSPSDKAAGLTIITPTFAEDKPVPDAITMLSKGFLDAPAKGPLPKVATLKKLIAQIPPPQEEERLAAEINADVVASDIKIVTGFECSTPLDIEKISPTHFAIRITTDSTLRNWFMFRVEGAKGQTVRIDIKDAPIGKWWSLNPVYSYCKSLDDLDAFKTTEVADPKPITAHNGPMLPDISGQQWHYMPNVWNDGESVYSFVQTFDEDGAYVAMRVPYTPKYNEAYLASIKDKPGVKVIEVGKSKEGRPLHVVQIGSGDPKVTPCVLMYAREHPSEHDNSWVVQGTIVWLLSDDLEARTLRERITLIAIPVLDPDGAAAGKYDVITQKFISDVEDWPAARAFATYFKEWVDRGLRLELALNLHNVESAEATHMFSAAFESEPKRREMSESFHRLVVKEFTGGGYKVMGRAPRSADLRSRLGGYLATMYGPLSLLYEVNSQEKSRHLTLEELQQMGVVFFKTSARFLISSEDTLSSNVFDMRQRRRLHIDQLELKIKGASSGDALKVEWAAWRLHQTLLQAGNVAVD